MTTTRTWVATMRDVPNVDELPIEMLHRIRAELLRAPRTADGDHRAPRGLPPAMHALARAIAAAGSPTPSRTGFAARTRSATPRPTAVHALARPLVDDGLASRLRAADDATLRRLLADHAATIARFVPLWPWWPRHPATRAPAHMAPRAVRIAS